METKKSKNPKEQIKTKAKQSSENAKKINTKNVNPVSTGRGEHSRDLTEHKHSTI